MNQNTKFSATYYPWIVFLLSAGFLFYKYAIEVSPSIMSNELMREFHIHGAQLGNLASFYFYAYLLMQIPVGLMIDKFGPRRLTTGAILICAGGIVTLSHAENFYLACAGRFITGMGATFAVISCLKLIAVWFKPSKTAQMVGFMLTIGMLGAVFGEAPLAASVNSVGWRTTLNAIALIGVIFSVIFYMVVRDENKNSELTYHSEPPKVLSALMILLKNPQNWYISIFSGLTFAPVAVFGGLWGVPFLMQAHGIVKTTAATDVSLLFIGFAIGSPLFGFWSDKSGKRKPLIYVGTLLSTLIICLIIYLPTHNNYLLSSLMFLFGFFISAFLLSFSMIREMNSLRYAATSVAFMNALNAALCAISDPLIGKFLDITWNGKLVDGSPVFSLGDYHLALVAMPIYLLIGLVFFWFVDETRGKQAQ